MTAQSVIAPAGGDTRAVLHLAETECPSVLVDPERPSVFDKFVVGQVLGKYELVERIGEGSTSVVFLGRHRKLQFPVALKVLDRTALSAAPHLRSVLLSEAIHLAQINHPNVVRLWDIDDEVDNPYLVLEYVRGGTLADLIRQKGRIPFAFAWAIGRQAVEGLAEAYKHGIVHRDVKPGNFLLGSDGHVKVADLGLAMIAGDRRSERVIEQSEGFVPAGTSAYLAPEQAGDPHGVDFRADIYALGATLYHALTGRFVFEGRSPLEVIMKHLREKPVPPGHYVADLPTKCSAVLMKMLAKRPEDRFASYDELRLELAQAVGDRRAPRPLAQSFLSFASGATPPA